jgi:NAD(P)-dependent dehydrogenase (short-subunit alcohol dehydrogenase family)
MSVRPLVSERVPEPPTYPELEDKRVVLVGMSAAAGASIARAFARQGCRIVMHVSDADGSAIDELTEEIRSVSAGLRVFKGALVDAAAIERLSTAALNAFGGADIVVTALGPLDGEALWDASVAAIDTAVCDALRLPCLAARAAAEQMSESGQGGLVLHVLDGQHAPAGGGGTTVLRGALQAMARAQASEWRGDGIRVNALIAEQANTRYADLESDDIGAATLYLASDRAAWISGTTVSVCG